MAAERSKRHFMHFLPLREMLQKCHWGVGCIGFAVLLLMAGCANITTPTGGKKDEIAPKVRRINPKDSLLNTRLKEVEINFDEYITVTDAAGEITISPLLPINPSVVVNNKSVKIKIPDTLLEDETTYRITTGRAIRDLHEGNIAGGVTFTFSTGAYFDSLSLRGRLINAQTGLPDTSGRILLYSARDSANVASMKKPLYLASIANDGSFKIKGLPPRRFRIFALKDNNNNLTYDDPTEGIAFADSIFKAGDTSNIELRIFKKDTVLPLTDSSAPGRRRQAQQKPPAYYTNIDTTDRSKKSFDIYGDAMVVFPIKAEVNRERITLIDVNKDSLQPQPVIFKETGGSPDTLSISYKWREASSYILKLAKGFAKDSSGNDLPPSRYAFTTKEADDYGKITINAATRYVKNNYLLTLTLDVESVLTRQVTDSNIVLPGLKPGKYTVRLIHDVNGNGKWDAGDLQTRKQPELVIPYPQLITVRPGWEQVIDFK